MLVFIITCWLGCLMQLMGCPVGASRHEILATMDSVNQRNMEEYKYHYKYPHPSVTTDCVIFGFDGEGLKVLLIERGDHPYKGSWAFPGGFLEMDESADEGAKRELMEETGLTAPFVKQFHTFSTPDRDPRERVLTVAYYALVRMSEVKGMDDAAQAKWFALDAIPKLAFDHEEIMRVAKEEIYKEIRLKTEDWQRMTEGFTEEEVGKIERELDVWH